MPTYKNVTSKKQFLEGKVIEPGQEVCSFVYYDENAVNLLKVDDRPFFNNIVYSGRIEKNTTIVIPKKDCFNRYINKFNIHFYAGNGEISIYYNETANMPALLLYPGCKWNARFIERNVDRLIIKSSSDFLLYVIIEKL